MRSSYLYLLSMLTHNYYPNDGYESLTEEEKLYMDATYKMLYDEDEKIKDASTKMMFLILRAYSSQGSNTEMSQDEVELEKAKIMDSLSDDEKKLIEAFGYACIHTICIYSEEAKKEREIRNEMILRLRKEMNK